MHKFILMSALLAASSLAGCPAKAAPTDANITGHVVDSETGEHMPYYTIRLLGTSIGTLTDASGHYTLRNLNPGNYTIEALCTGYKTLQKEVAIEHGRTLEINFDVTPDAFMLEQVVVTGSKSEQKRRNSPVLVSVVNNKIFDQVSACSLADGLNFQPGVRVENDCQNCGFTQVRINGLDGHYSQILIDSHPIFSSLAGVYGLEQIPANMIERVEVLRGGGSALFGASAIGGTINVITRDPVRNTAQAAHTITSVGCGSACDNNTSFNASLVSDNSKAGLYVYGQNRHRSGYDHDGDGFTELPVLTQQTAGARAFLRTGATSRLSAQYHHIGEYRRGGDRLGLPPHEALVAEQTDHSIDGGSLTFDFWTPDRSDRLDAYVSFQNTARRSYYGTGEDPDAYGRTHDITVASGVQYIHTFDRLWFMPSELTLGAEYNFDGLEDESIGYGMHTEQDVHIVGGYFQNEWKTERWSLLVGGRVDKHNLVDHAIFSPRANVRFNPTRDVNLRVSYSGG